MLHDQFSTTIPLWLAPMAGGPVTPALAAAVCESGGLGALGAAYLPPEKIRAEAEALRALTKRPFQINLFVPSAPVSISKAQFENVVQASAPYRKELGLPNPTSFDPPFDEPFEPQFEAMLAAKPAAFSFVFGRLPAHYLRECEKQKIFTVGTATTLEEAKMLESDGVGAIVLQGKEAGGHRAIFDPSTADPDLTVTSLLQACAPVIRKPLIAAGGLRTKEQIHAALKAGAQAVQLGSIFLLSQEAGTSAPYRQALRENRSTRLTRAFSGRLARGLENKFLCEMEGRPILPFPAQNKFTRDIRGASTKAGSPEFLSLWSGMGEGPLPEKSAAEIVRNLF